MKITNGISLLVLSGLIVSCVQEKVSTDIDKTFKAPGAFNSIISNGSEPDKQPKQPDSEQQKPEETEQPKPLTEEEIINKKKLEYLEQLSEQGFVGLKCNSTGCASLTESMGIKGEHVINAHYFVNEDSIKPFEPDTKSSGTTKYKADTIVKTKRYSYDIKNHKGTMELNIDNTTGYGNAKTSIKDMDSYDTKDIDIEYQDIDFTKEKFNSNKVSVDIEYKPMDCKDCENPHHYVYGDIEGSLSGDSNSNGNFNANITGSTNIEIKGIFNGKEKEVHK